MDSCDVTVIGAGPYGLSVAAHLGAAGVDYRIIGRPMEFWLKHMPKGMHLKSEGFASSLADPGSTFTLKDYCAEKNLPYADIGKPVPLEQFSNYGLEFQKRFVPNVIEQKVSLLQKSSDGFRVTLDNGEVIAARRVVVAVGLTYYQYLPEEFSSLPEGAVTHASAHSSLEEFKGRDVAVVGAGASALDIAALLHEGGATVQLIARTAKLKYHDPPDGVTPSWIQQLQAPMTGIGPGWKLWMCANLPGVFRLMPKEFRLQKVRQVLGPAPCWFIKERVEGKIRFHLGATIKGVAVRNGRVTVTLSDGANGVKTIETDHVIAATGYKYDVRRLSFLDSPVVSQLDCVGNTPSLSSHFESSVKGLYFIGVTAANTFGPLLRFAHGAGFAAPRLSRHLAQTASESLPVGARTSERRAAMTAKSADSVSE